jgi:hypothetical protein
MMEIVAKPLYVTLLELLLEFHRSEPALRVMVSKLRFEFRHSRAALRIMWPSFGNTTVVLDVLCGFWLCLFSRFRPPMHKFDHRGSRLRPAKRRHPVASSLET